MTIITRAHDMERRIYTVEFREAIEGSKGRQRWATAVTYDTVDDYGTIWNEGVFDKALAERMPTFLYGHDWTNLLHVLGKGIDFRQTPPDVGPPGCDVLLEFDDPEFVPLARQAMHQVEVRTLRDMSVGFERREWIRKADLSQADLAAGAEERMLEAGMDELSLVIRAAVVGAQMRGVRSQRGPVDLDAVVAIAKQKAAGELTEEEAQAAVDLLAGIEPAASDEPPPPGTETPPPEGELPPPAEQAEPDPAATPDLLDADAADFAMLDRSR